MKELKVGDQAPKLELNNHRGERVNLEELKGKRVLLSFYPVAFTPVWENQLKALDEHFNIFTENNTLVYGISIDSQYTQAAWYNHLELKNIQLLADFWPHGKVASDYGVFRSNDGISERVNILIDEEGKIKYTKLYDLGTLPDINEILDKIKG